MRSRSAFVLVGMALAVAALAWAVWNPFRPAAQAAEAPANPNAKALDQVAFKEHLVPFLNKYCNGCHNDQKQAAGLSLAGYKDEASLLKDRDVWEKVRQNVHDRQMPPKKKTQPSDVERAAVVKFLETKLARVDCGLKRDPGRVTIRRLNRAEYNNTIRDLVGVNFQPAADFPADDVGYGFDNIGDVLSMPPILLEKYMAAAERILNAAIVLDNSVKVSKDPFRPQNLQSTLGREARQRGRIAMTSNGSVYLNYDFLYEGEYVVRVRAYGEQAGNELPKMAFQFERKDVKVVDVAAVEGRSQTYEARIKVTPGKKHVGIAFTNHFADKDAKDPKKRARNLYLQSLEIEGPFNARPKPLPESHTRILIAKPTGPNDKEAAAEKVIANFAKRAYRRPVKPEEVARLMKLFRFVDSQGESFERSIQITLRAVLVSPHFLFRIEVDREPNNPDAVHPVNEFELATRLSYFLWSSMPDDELFSLAEKGRLRQPGVLEAQVKRMLKDPKARALTDNFAAQWLNLRILQTLAPDRRTFPGFDDSLRAAMQRETELFFEHVVKEDRSVLELLDSDYTFVNGRLAKHYGIPNVSGEEFRKITLTDRNRGGIITQASVLTLTSNPTRTSPVKRGKWILENIFASPPPPPSPDAGELPDDKKQALTGTLRQRMEQHRANPACATCHQRMDPLGFGLENFDGIGAWRTADGKFMIDASGTLPGGQRFNGPAELRKVLLGMSDQFRRCLAEKLLTYALGRGLEYYDKCAVDDIVTSLKKGNDRFSALAIAVVKSDPFQKRRGKRSERP